MTVEQQPITRLNNQISSYNAKISALGTVQSALASFQSAVQGLNSLTFNSFSATSSNSAVLSATASSIAKPGNYSLTVSQLAQAQNLVVAGQASATTAIGSGASTTLTFDFGTISGGTLTNGTYTGASFASNGGATKSVTIDSSNNTLSGIRDAINAANIGVTASIINDGSASPYRLVLTSNTTGVANSMKISVAGDATLSGLLAEDPAGTQNLSQTSAASERQFHGQWHRHQQSIQYRGRCCARCHPESGRHQRLRGYVECRRPTHHRSARPSMASLPHSMRRLKPFKARPATTRPPKPQAPCRATFRSASSNPRWLPC